MKKAILVVSFGTSYKETREKTIEACEKALTRAFEGYDFYRAFTSKIIIKKIARKEGIQIEDPEEALTKLHEAGYEEVIVQSLHLLLGEEYDRLKDVVTRFKDQFKTLKLGRPLLTYKEDYDKIIEAISSDFEGLGPDEAVVYMGHGTAHSCFSAYCALEYMLHQRNMKGYIGTVEGYPGINEVIKKLKANHIKKVYLLPLMLVAGDHAINDMASDEEDSWKTILVDNKFEVKSILRGFGENPAIQQLFVGYAKELI